MPQCLCLTGKGSSPLWPTLQWGQPWGTTLIPWWDNPYDHLSLSIYPFLSQSPGMPFPTSISPSPAGLLALLDLGKEEHPLVVESPSCSSWVVVGGMIPTIMVSSSAVETTLSASPRLTPRVSTSSVSTSSANVTGRDVHRVIQQCPLSSPNTALIGAGVGRGQVLAKKLMKAGVGKGQSVPSSKAMRPQEHRGHTDTSTSVDIPPPITMRLDHQGPPVSYSEVASRPPQSETTTQGTLWMCGSRLQLMNKKRQLLRPPWTISINRNGTSKPPKERKRNVSPKKLTSMRPSKDWWRRGLSGRMSITGSEGPSGLVLTLSLNPSDGLSKHGLNRTSTRVLNGLGTCGVPAPWTINN